MRDVVKILSDEYRKTLENVIPSKIKNENYKINSYIHIPNLEPSIRFIPPVIPKSDNDK